MLPVKRAEHTLESSIAISFEVTSSSKAVREKKKKNKETMIIV